MRETEYFWSLCSIIDVPEYGVQKYSRLLGKLYSIPFTWTVKNDINRASDGTELRVNIIGDERAADELGPCRVLEMMIALAIRCETDIMQEKSQGNRTAIWFWTMIENLGLAGMENYCFNESYIEAVVNKFLGRRYSRNGEGSIFFVNHRTDDLRRVELWYQMCWFLSEQYDFAI